MKIAPSLTYSNNKGELIGVKYDRLHILLINAIKEQQQQIDQAQARNQAAIQSTRMAAGANQAAAARDLRVEDAGLPGSSEGGDLRTGDEAMNGIRRDQLISIPLLVMLMVLSTHNALAQSASRAATPRSEGSQRCNLWIPVLCRLRALKTRQNC